MTNDFILQDRIQKIQQVVTQYKERNFYIAYSGGKDSNVLSALIDLALPNNQIPRVYCNTGIEYKLMTEFVQRKYDTDRRFLIVQPKVPITKMLQEVGYPFKSKQHSHYLDIYQRNNNNPEQKSIAQYLGNAGTWSRQQQCPKCLRYQFDPKTPLSFKVSPKCCDELKKKPMKDWMYRRGKSYSINGIMREEGGQRRNANCMSFRDGYFKSFQPLVPLTKEWEDWFIKEYNIQLPDLYYPPYNFERTGCKGCPFAVNLQHELDVLSEILPNEAKQCEIIWKPVYDEYRRIGYRLHS